MAIITENRPGLPGTDEKRAVSLTFRRANPRSFVDCGNKASVYTRSPFFQKQATDVQIQVDTLPPPPIVQPDVPNLSASAVTLNMLKPQNTAELVGLTSRYVDNKDLAILDALSDPARRDAHELKRMNKFFDKRGLTRTQDNLAEYIELRASQLLQQEKTRIARINGRAHGVLKEDLGLQTTRVSRAEFKKQSQHADAAVEAHSAQLYPKKVAPAIPEIVANAQTPADIVLAYFSSQDSDIRFAAQRKALLTLISAQVEKLGREGADKKLDQVQTLLENQLFQGEPYDTDNIDTFGIFDNRTNEIAIFFDGQPTLLDEQPTVPAPPGHHYKHFEFPMRKIKGTHLDGFMLIDRKKRPSALDKVLFEATKRDDKGESDDIRPQDVDDAHRLMIVVKGTDQDAERIRQKVSDILIDGTNALCNRDDEGRPIRDGQGKLTGLPIDIEIKDGTKSANGNAAKVGHKRIMVKIDGLPNPIEIIVKSEARYVNVLTDIGEYDPSTKEPTGIAHPIYKMVKRAPGVDQTYLPQEVYPSLQRPYQRQADGTFPPNPVLEETVNMLRNLAVFEPETAKK